MLTRISLEREAREMKGTGLQRSSFNEEIPKRVGHLKNNKGKQLFLIASILFSVVFWALESFGSSDSKSLTIVLPARKVDLSLSQMKLGLKVVAVEIQDPVYKKTKAYDGFRLSEVLALAGFESKSLANELVFTSKDGYAPNTSFDNLLQQSAVLVFREHGKKDFAFEKVLQGKSMITPAPFYVIWEKAPSAEAVPWPYQLVQIEVVDFKVKYAKLYPLTESAGTSVAKGFSVFKSECLRCHSINLQGGELGPELNVPKNVTEYWAPEILKSFVRNSADFRLRDKMPSFLHLKPEQLDDVLAYLAYMKDHKIDHTRK